MEVSAAFVEKDYHLGGEIVFLLLPVTTGFYHLLSPLCCPVGPDN